MSSSSSKTGSASQPQQHGRTAKQQVPINVVLPEKELARIRREEEVWTGPRLVLLATVTLAISIAILYLMASV